MAGNGSEEFGFIETVREFRSRDPFVPFRITMTSGERYTIENPELLAFGKSQLVYCLPHSDRTAHLRMNQIASVQEVEVKAPRRRR